MAKGGFGRTERGKTMVSAINRYFARKGLSYSASLKQSKTYKKSGVNRVGQYRVEIRDGDGRKVNASRLAKQGLISTKDAQRINRLGNITSRNKTMDGRRRDDGALTKANRKMTREHNSMKRVSKTKKVAGKRVANPSYKVEKQQLMRRKKKLAGRDVANTLKQDSTVKRNTAKKAEKARIPGFNKMPAKTRSIKYSAGSTATVKATANKQGQLVVNFGGKKMSKTVMKRAEGLAKQAGLKGVKASNYKASTAKKKKS